MTRLTAKHFSTIESELLTAACWCLGVSGALMALICDSFLWGAIAGESVIDMQAFGMGTRVIVVSMLVMLLLTLYFNGICDKAPVSAIEVEKRNFALMLRGYVEDDGKFDKAVNDYFDSASGIELTLSALASIFLVLFVVSIPVAFIAVGLNGVDGFGKTALNLSLTLFTEGYGLLLIWFAILIMRLQSLVGLRQ